VIKIEKKKLKDWYFLNFGYLFVEVIKDQEL
jgi:hypothetical protein